MHTSLQNSFENSSGSGIVTYQDSVIIDANDHFLDTTDFSLNDLLGMPILKLFTPDSHGITQRIMSAQECSPVEIYGLCKNGTAYLSEVVHVPTNQTSRDGIFYLKNITGKFDGQQFANITTEEMMSILNDMQDTYYRTNAQGEIIWLSPSIITLLGYSPSDIIGNRFADYYWEDDGQENFIRQLNVSGGAIYQYEMPLRHRNNSLVWVSANAHYYYDDHGNPLGIECSTRDITQLRIVQEALHAEKEQALVTLAAIVDGVVRTNNSQIIEYINPAAEQICGLSSEAAVGRTLNEIFCLSMEDNGEPFSCSLENCCAKLSSQIIPREVILTRPDGKTLTLEHSASPVLNSQNEPSGIVVIFRDITNLHSMAKVLHHQASHDALTGLINRYQFEHHLNALLAHDDSKQEQHVLCCLDLDQFKIVNDTCGHIAGDELLRQLTARFQISIREQDILARIGGDEFSILLENTSIDEAITIVDRVRRTTLDYRFQWEDKVFQLGVSIGLVLITDTDINFTHLLGAADSACYIAKNKGGNRIHVYEEEDEAIAHHKGEIHWIQKLKRALNEDRFVLHQQVARSLNTKRNPEQYIEFLLRMIDDNNDLVTPDNFIATAERYHLIQDIDKWVVRTVLSMLSDDNLNRQNIYAINISAQSICDRNFIDHVISLLENAGEALAKIICFEITETSAITNLTEAIQFITQLKHMGCRFALDDFGSGLSSFGYLKNLPVDYLKIDGSFIQNMVNDPVDQAMVRTINEIGHLMNKTTIAECVETRENRELLHIIGVDYVQGFHIDLPSEKKDTGK